MIGRRRKRDEGSGMGGRESEEQNDSMTTKLKGPLPVVRDIISGIVLEDSERERERERTRERTRERDLSSLERERERERAQQRESERAGVQAGAQNRVRAECIGEFEKG
jgi:hypothetical protein